MDKSDIIVVKVKYNWILMQENKFKEKPKQSKIYSKDSKFSVRNLIVWGYIKSNDTRGYIKSNDTRGYKLIKFNGSLNSEKISHYTIYFQI